MFRQMVERQWKEYRAERPDVNIIIPEVLVDFVELVLEGDRLVEQKRLPGQNTVNILHYYNYPSFIKFVLFIIIIIV